MTSVALAEGYSVVVVDPRSLSDAEIAETAQLDNLLLAEAFPESEPRPEAVAIAAVRATPARLGRWEVRVQGADGALVAAMAVQKDWEGDANPDVGGLQISVHPDHRGRGIGTVLLAHRAGLARALGQTRFFPNTNDRLPAGAALAMGLGAVCRTRMHVNRLDLATVDRPLLERWVEEAAQRAAGYDLVAVDGPIPVEIEDAYVDLALVMNAAPLDDLEVNDFTFTVADQRAIEQRDAAVGAEVWTLLARDATGTFAGFHDVAVVTHDPTVVWVRSTGVLPAHRGHALGKWLKAAMTLRILDERPDAAFVRTGNADSNAPMLGINRTMGYAPWLATATWEVSRAQVESWLAVRAVAIPDLDAVVVPPGSS